MADDVFPVRAAGGEKENQQYVSPTEGRGYKEKQFVFAAGRDEDLSIPKKLPVLLRSLAAGRFRRRFYGRFARPLPHSFSRG